MKEMTTMTRLPRLLLFLLALLTFPAPAFAQVAPARKLPSATFQRFATNGTDFKDALSACNAARQGTGWKAIGADPPNKGGGVNCKYKKGGSSGEQVGASLVLRCPDNASPWTSGGTIDVTKQVCACYEGFVAKGLSCVKEPEKCDPATWKVSDKNTQTSNGSGNAGKLEKNLPGAGVVHHIVFSTWTAGERGRLAIDSRAILDKFCIDINAKENGVRLTPEMHNRTGLHTTFGALKVYEALTKATTREQALAALATLSQLILSKQLVPGHLSRSQKVRVRPAPPEQPAPPIDPACQEEE
jgi:hypothetical protein